MSIFNVTNYDVESFSLETNPKTYFASSSSGIVGAQYVFSRKSNSIKNELEPTIDSFFNDSNGEELTIASQEGGPNNWRSVKVKKYFDKINKLPSKNPYKIINRLVPTYDDPPDISDSSYDPLDLKKEVNEMKSIISGTLFPYYRNIMTNSEFSYTNYSCLNFVSSSETSADSALIYPNVNDSLKISNQFTINFHINVRNKYSTAEFRPGTVLHLSSVYAVSVISGTLRDESGLIKTYGIQLQLNHSADIPPSQASYGPRPRDLIWKFDDVLNYNSWHDVTLTWAGLEDGKKIYNDATGSLYVDGILGGNFVVPSSSLTRGYSLRNKPHLVIGNYYNGEGNMSDFFNETMSKAYGIKYLSSTGTTEKDFPFSYSNLTNFNHGGFFELHDINIKNTVSQQSQSRLTSTPESFDDYQFYLSPFFNETSKLRKVIDKNASIKKGGVMITPRHAVTGSTSTPFNVAMSFGVGAHVMNLENHLLESRYGYTPFILNMSASAAKLLGDDTSMPINDYYYSRVDMSSSIKANNLLIMPCDDGTFRPKITHVNLTNYHITNNEATAGLTIGQRLGRELWDSNPNTSELEKLKFNEDSLRKKLSENGPTPAAYSTNPDLLKFDPTKAIPAWIRYSETKSDDVSGTDRRFPGAAAYKFFDRDSRQIVIFDISNLYYGNSILPESFMLTDSSLTGSGGRTSITIKDDGRGGLYRADSLTTHATFNNVGNIFYNEGIVLIKNPSLYFVGKDSYEISFKGNRNVHILKVETIANRGFVNKSVNETYIDDLKPSADQIDDDENFVYISGINYHDDNLNVVARVKLAQPILKREYSKIAFRMKLDF